MSGCVDYYFDKHSNNCDRIEVPFFSPVLRIKKYQEQFALTQPSHFENGIPIFTVLRGFPVSLQKNWREVIAHSDKNLFEVRESIKTMIEKGDYLVFEEEDEDGNILEKKREKDTIDIEFEDSFTAFLAGNLKESCLTIESGYSSADIDAKVDSIYVQRIFRGKPFTKLHWFVLAIWTILVVIITYTIVIQW